MKTYTRLFSPLLIESAEEVLRDEYERKLGHPPIWWYPCAVVACGIPIATLILIIVT